MTWRMRASAAKVTAPLFSAAPRRAPDGAEFAVADIDQYEALALTVEPGPLGGTAPTSEPIVVAPFAAA